MAYIQHSYRFREVYDSVLSVAANSETVSASDPIPVGEHVDLEWVGVMIEGDPGAGTSVIEIYIVGSIDGKNWATGEHASHILPLSNGSTPTVTFVANEGLQRAVFPLPVGGLHSIRVDRIRETGGNACSNIMIGIGRAA